MRDIKTQKSTWNKALVFLTASVLGLSAVAAAQPEWEEPGKSKQAITPSSSTKPDAQQSEIEGIAEALKRLNEFIELDSKVTELTAQYQEKCEQSQAESDSSAPFTPLESDNAAQQCSEKVHEDTKDSTSLCSGEACSPEVGHCKSYTIRCRKNGDAIIPGIDGVRGGCNSSTCEIFLLTSMCELMGWNDGDRFCHNCFWRQIREKDPTTFLDVVDVCLVAHEGQHAIDGPKMRNCATEENAFDRQASCMRSYYESLCRSAPPRMSELECKQLSATICVTDGQKALQTCRCERGSPRQGKPCPACEQRCNDTANSCVEGANLGLPPEELRELVKSDCAVTERGYCRRRL